MGDGLLPKTALIIVDVLALASFVTVVTIPIIKYHARRLSISKLIGMALWIAVQLLGLLLFLSGVVTLLVGEYAKFMSPIFSITFLIAFSVMIEKKLLVMGGVKRPIAGQVFASLVVGIVLSTLVALLVSSMIGR